MTSDTPRDTKGRWTQGVDQPAPQAVPTETNSSTELNAVDGEDEESRRTTTSIPDTEPRGNDPWRSLATPGPEKSKIGMIYEEQEQEMLGGSPEVNRNLQEQLAQAKMESARLQRSLSQARNQGSSSSDSEEAKQTEVELRRKMRKLRRKAIKEMNQDKKEGEDDASKELPKPSSSSDSEESLDSETENKAEAKLLSKMKTGGEERTEETDEEPLDLLWSFLNAKDLTRTLCLKTRITRGQSTQ
jgi:hypothetical protein